MLFTLPAANEMLPLSALFAGEYRDGMAAGILKARPHWTDYLMLRRLRGPILGMPLNPRSI